jgi:hypothetical protein
VQQVAPRFLRFMTLSMENLCQALPLLRKILSPEQVSAVMLAIETQDSSKLPKKFKTTRRILTDTDQMDKSEAENSKVNLLDLMHTNSGYLQEMVSAATSQLPGLESINLSDSTVYPLVVNKLGEVRFAII